MTALLTLLNLIPGVSSLVQFIVGKWMDSKVTMYQVRMGVAKDVAISAIQAEVTNNQTKVGWLHEVANSRFLQFIVGGFAFPLICYFNKAIVWDKIVHKFLWGTYGFTPGIEDLLVGNWANLIIGGIFVTGTGMGIAGAIAKRTAKE